MKKYIAEFIGTFALSFTILLAVSTANSIIAVPVIAGLILTIFVYTIGSISGSHINPAVTLGLLSIKRISIREALYYIVSQIMGAIIAIIIAKMFSINCIIGPEAWSGKTFFAEIFGAMFFAFGIASVVYSKVSDVLSGLVIGGSLILGILIALFTGSIGIINPAVAIALNSYTFVYLIAPIIGSVIGFNVYKYISA